jgi:hypothetical protein
MVSDGAGGDSPQGSAALARRALAAAGITTLDQLSRADEDEVAHRPDAVVDLRPASPVDLTVAGHTDGGQIVVPGFGPLLRLWPGMGAKGVAQLRQRQTSAERGLSFAPVAQSPHHPPSVGGSRFPRGLSTASRHRGPEQPARQVVCCRRVERRTEGSDSQRGVSAA